MAFHMKPIHFLIPLVFFFTFISSSHARTFQIGGNDGWILHPSENYNSWSSRLRFLINDTLHFKYDSGSDSVLVVNKGDYDGCNGNNPITKLDGGDSTFKFDRSGPFYFITGNKSNCDQGQKLTVVVLALRNRSPPPSVATPPSSSTVPPSPAISPVLSPPMSPVSPDVASPALPPSTSPASSPSGSPVTPSRSPDISPAGSPESSPSGTPIFFPPAPSPGEETADSPGSGGTADSPRSGGTASSPGGNGSGTSPPGDGMTTPPPSAATPLLPGSISIITLVVTMKMFSLWGLF